MKHIIVIVGQRFITLLVAFGLLNPAAASIRAGSDSAPSIGITYATPDQGWAKLSTIELATASHDNAVDLGGLGHNSRDLIYRTPGGPVEIGTSITLRLRAASGDLTAAKVRIFNDRQNTLSILDMSLVADDGTSEWWQITIQSPALSTVCWYRFIAIDGSDMDFYADDNDLLGGLGSPSEGEVDNSWQLTFYDPNFQTPDWVQNGIIYQIFPDRFSDGNTSNDTLPDSYYGEDSAIFRSGTSYWNEAICDPLNESGPCPGVYGENFYGGDLQGVINKLDYLDQLGVNAIYFNPIFKSPSNHGYDTNNYQNIDNSLGDKTLFTNLVSLAATRGIMVILDGVFNYTSSDSVYFDLYQLYDGIGACEGLTSYNRDWYFFYDVTPGTGPCVGSNGTANSADYISWAGDDKFPLLDSTNHEVQEQFWKEGPTTPIAPWWSSVIGVNGWRLDSGAEIDPGVLSNAANLYWEGFRDAIRLVQPTAYIVGEEWGNGTSWTLGSEWDASTNYQFSTAVLGFWRDEPFIDNDHYTGSAAGVIEPLLPSQLNERLLNLQERYAPEALAAMMNLLDSHDTNRALFMLDHNTDQNNTSLYLNPSYNWSDAITRLKGAVLLQMTLPGAPTIYYGDEVGLVGPVTYDTSVNTWQDDPYNRMPYPWLGTNCTANCGTPFYTYLQSQYNQDLLRNYYILLTSTRNAHPALRTGSFDPLLVDDPNLVYAYGRRLLYPADAAVIVINRSPQIQSVTLNLSGYLPATLPLFDVLHNNAQYSIASDGSLTVGNVPAMSGVLLVFASGDLTPPGAPLNLVALEGESQVDLTWSAVSGATTYQVYRSLVSGGGYEPIGTTAFTNYTDTGVINGTRYYYGVRTTNSLGMVSNFSIEINALPHWAIDWAILQSPIEITHTIGLSSTQNVYGQVNIEGITILPGATDTLISQVGYGLDATPPSDWITWIDAPFDSDQESRDQFASALLPESTGDFQVVYRYSTNNGLDWTYADLDGIFTGTPSNPSILHVLPSDDITPPATPGNLRLVDWGDHFVAMSWDPLPEDPSLYAYDIYRSTDISSSGVPIGRVSSSITEYTDTQITSGITYYYQVQAIDSSFNRSALSNQISGSTTTRQITVTFNVVVPDFTYGTVFIVGDHPKVGSWDPDKIPLTKIGENTWVITLTFEEGVQLAYKFTRGNYAWLDIETAADGNTDIPNRTLLVEADSSGTIVVNATVANWRDPLIAQSYPSNRATEVPINPVITMTWSQAMESDTAFTLTGSSDPITGTLTYNPSTWTVSFTPSEYLQVDTTYTITASYQTDVVGDPQLVQYSWTFTTIEAITIHTVALPIVRKN